MFRFINIIVLSSSQLEDKVISNLEKKNCKKYFNNRSIRTIICAYNDRGELEEILSNYD